MELLSEKEKQHYINFYNCQEGRPYACSNQVVICGIITHTQEQAIDYMNAYPEYQLIRQSHNQLIWINQTTNQEWKWVRPNVNARGYRFYKVKISSIIEKNDFYERILPCCALYCCNMEFI